MNIDLNDTIENLVISGKGILAADESSGTIAKRFQTIQLDSTEENRRRYRELLCTTPGLNEYISGIILYEETLTQRDKHGKLFTEILTEQGIVPGIKVDKGLVSLANTNDEKVTQGLDGLSERLIEYRQHGARFAKWRNVYNISETTPSLTAIKTGAENLARYAAVCQNEDIVPIVEPEVLMDGDHPIELCAEITEVVLHELFDALYRHQVELSLIILKPNMVLAGQDCKERPTATDIADYTLEVFRNNVPAAVPSINFLSGGQSPEEATRNLNAINLDQPHPWYLSFSYGRALQEPCLATWKGLDANVAAAQQALLQRAKLNAFASLGQYRSDME